METSESAATKGIPLAAERPMAPAPIPGAHASAVVSGQYEGLSASACVYDENFRQGYQSTAANGSERVAQFQSSVCSAVGKTNPGSQRAHANAWLRLMGCAGCIAFNMKLASRRRKLSAPFRS